jgi:hypothetical protein
VGPPRFLRHPENASYSVFVWVLKVGIPLSIILGGIHYSKLFRNHNTIQAEV